MRILAIDFGTRRLGIAISDPLGFTAQPLSTLERKNPGEDIRQIKELCDERQVGTIVVGIPVNMDGSPAVQHDNALAFAESVAKATGLPVKHWDERLTTAEAERLLLQNDTSRKKRKKVIDKMAAALILQSYMETKTGG